MYEYRWGLENTRPSPPRAHLFFSLLPIAERSHQSPVLRPVLCRHRLHIYSKEGFIPSRVFWCSSSDWIHPEPFSWPAEAQNFHTSLLLKNCLLETLCGVVPCAVPHNTKHTAVLFYVMQDHQLFIIKERLDVKKGALIKITGGLKLLHRTIKQ